MRRSAGLRWAALTLLLSAMPAAALDFVVNNGADVIQGNQCVSGFPCGLREAVQIALGQPGEHRVLISVAQCDLNNDIIIDNARLAILGIGVARANIRVVPANRRAFLVRNSDLTLRRLDIQGGNVVGQGGAIAAFPLTELPRTRLRIDDSAISQNETDEFGSGGGIYARATDVILDRVELRGNRAGYGAGMQVTEGTLVARDCLFEQNLAGNDGGGLATADSSVLLSNSLMNGNQAGAFGGAALFSVNQIQLTNVTLVANAATFAGSAMTFSGSGTTGTLNNLTVRHNGNPTSSVLAYLGSPPVALRNSIVSGACTGAPSASSGNIESPGNSCGLSVPGNQVSVSEAQLALGALASNGGPTDSMLPQAGSVAINNGGSGCARTDQRGRVRNVGACDVGAIEVGAVLNDRIFANAYELP